jgi:hypothetical protein
MPDYNHFDKRLQANATSGNGEAAELGGVTCVTAYIVGNGAVSAGAVQLEHSHSKDYTGTWAPLGAATTVVANSVVAVIAVSQTFKAIRARISTPVTGGTVSVHVLAN